MDAIFEEAIVLMNKHKMLGQAATRPSDRKWHNRQWFIWLRVAANHA